MKVRMFHWACVCAMLGLVGAISSAQAAEGDNWVQKVNLSGDFRYRHEYIDQKDVINTNQRHRLRARTKMDVRVSDDLKYVMQLSTGTFETTSTNQTLDGNYDKKFVDFDMMYIDWSAASSSHVLAGKVKNTLYTPGGSELLWDADVTFEGVTWNWEPASKGMPYFVNVGGYWFDERNGEGAGNAQHSDTLQVSAQVGTELSAQGHKIVAGLGYHTFSAMKNHTATTANGNSTTGGGNYLYGFDILELFASVDTDVANQPAQIYFNYASNSAASNNGSAYLLGINFKKLKTKGDWTIGYNYRNVEADSVVGALTESDFAAGETNSRGHKIQAQYQLASAVVGGFTYHKCQRNVSTVSTDYDRMQLDLNFKF